MNKLFTFCFLALTPYVYGQPLTFTTLQPGKTVRTALTAGQVDHYKIELTSGQFASLKIYQESIGVGFSVFAPNDSVLEHADYNALYQYETITINATMAGEYRIDVYWDYGKPAKGLYSIAWDTVEPIGQTPETRAAQLFDSWYKDDEPGAAVLVVKDNQVVYKGWKGLANIEHHVPIAGNSAFELASVSKQFTGFAIAMLIEKGKMSLDDDIRKFLPEVPDFGKTITVRHLVFHTSGMSNWDNLTNASGYKAEDIITSDMVRKLVANSSDLNFTPGDTYAYSNTGYWALAQIVERVSGITFAEWMKQNVFQPLGMDSSLVKDDFKKVVPRKVYGYRATREGFELIPDTYAVPGASSVHCTIDDLLKWVNNFNTGQVGGKNVLEIIRTKGTLNNGQPIGYSFGNFSEDYKGIFKREHFGLVLGFRTAIARYPQQKLAVVYLSNDANDATYGRSRQMADVFLTGKKEGAIKNPVLPEVKEYLQGITPFQPEKNPSSFTEYEGLYFAKELDVSFTIKMIDGLLTIFLPRTENIVLKSETPDVFKTSFPVFKRQIEFQRDSNKKITGFYLVGGDDRILFDRRQVGTAAPSRL